MKEQNKLWGENELAENRRKKPNNLLNHVGVKGLFEPFRSKKALWRKLELPAFANGRQGATFERLLQTWILAGVQNSACKGQVGNSSRRGCGHTGGAQVPCKMVCCYPAPDNCHGKTQAAVA